MERINFNARRRKLHLSIVSSIVRMMREKNCSEIVFDNPSGARPRILKWYRHADWFENVKVKMVRTNGKSLQYKATQSEWNDLPEKDWLSLKKNVADAHIIELYDAVYDHLFVMNNTVA